MELGVGAMTFRPVLNVEIQKAPKWRADVTDTTLAAAAHGNAGYSNDRGLRFFLGENSRRSRVERMWDLTSEKYGIKRFAKCDRKRIESSRGLGRPKKSIGKNGKKGVARK